MKYRYIIWMALLSALCTTTVPARAGNWSQFRGPNASGRPEREAKLPDAIGPETNVLWKTPLPPGHSSPVIHGDRIYVTAVRNGQLLTIALDRESGSLLWEKEAPHEQLEEVHTTGSHAQPTPATDGERVVSLFGSCGLFCFDDTGKLLWKQAMGPFKNDFGAGSSPIIVDDRVIVCQDHDTDSFLAAYDKKSGERIWKTDRSEFPRNYCSPVIWEVNGKKQIVVAATLRIVGYDFDTGEEVWTVRGVARIVNMTPVVGDDGVLYAACWSPGADADSRISVDPFDDFAKEHDSNSSGTLEVGELPDGPIKMRFTQIDRDKSGQITREEYESMRRVFDLSRNVVVAIRPGGIGEITDSHVLWTYSKSLPYCPSPLYYRGSVLMIKNGGILAVLDAKTGRPIKEARVSATDEYYASPVGGDNKAYLLSRQGKLTVLSAREGWKEISSADFKELSYATPAIVDGRIYVRTNGNLYCFGEKAGK